MTVAPRDLLVLFASIAVFLLLVALDISGSSIGRWQEQFPDEASGVLIGESRPIRSDEWLVGTPLAVGQARMGSPARAYVGTTDMTFDVSSYAAPSRSFGAIFRPQTWGYLLVGPSRGLAWQWWMPLLLAFLGLFAVFRLSRLGAWASVVLAVLGAFTPYAAWWSLWPNLAIGFGACAAAMFLVATRVRHRGLSILFAGAAGWLVVCLALFLYPPWTIPVAYVLGAAVLGTAIDTRVATRRIITCVLIAGAVAIGSLATWYALHRQAVSDFSSTVYPGQRRLESGGGDLSYLFDAFANPLLSLDLPLAYGNLSEAASSYVLLPLAVVSAFVTLAVAGPLRRTGRVPFVAPLLVLGTSAVLLIWSFGEGVPAAVGSVLLLDRIPASRLPLALGLATLLLIGYAVPALKARVMARGVERDWALAASAIGLALGGVATIIVCTWSALAVVLPGAIRGGHYTGPNELPVVIVASIAVVVASLVVLQFGRWRVLSGLVIMAYVITSFALVNPVQKGLGPLGQLVVSDEHERVAVFGPSALSDIPRMRGQEVVSGTAIYPNPAFWRAVPSVDPFVWNRYVQWTWQPKAGSPAMEGSLTQADSAVLYVNPCSQPVRALDIMYFYSTVPLFGSCLTPNGTEQWGAATMYVYRRM